MRLSDFREYYANRTGAIPAGAQAAARFRSLVQQAIKYIGAGAPELMLRGTYNFALEVGFTGVCQPDPGDRRILTDETMAIPSANLPDPLLMRGRWIRVRRSTESQWWIYRIRDFIRPTLDHAGGIFVLDRDWPTSTDEDLVYEVYTEEYPVPENARDEYLVSLADDAGSETPLAPAHHADTLQNRRASGTISGQSRPARYSTGDFTHLEGPRQAPVAALDEAQKWGYPLGTEQTQCGPPGKFQYCYCLVWGRRPYSSRVHAGTTASTFPGNATVLPPLYISGASVPSSEVTVTGWNTDAVKLTSPDIDYVFGFAANPSNVSHHHSGLEKWWFRRRITTGNPGNSAHPSVEADGVFYLWRITPAYETETWDLGNSDPPDRFFQLRDWTGHRSIQFDCYPSIAYHMSVSYAIRIPDVLNDNDTLPLPPGAEELLFARVQLFRLGDQENNAAARMELEATYRRELARLREVLAPKGAGTTMGVSLVPGWREVPFARLINPVLIP